MTQKFGLSAALTTPFKTDGTVDIDAMIAHARRCLSNGCDSVTLFGTTGEGCSVGSREPGSSLPLMMSAVSRATISPVSPRGAWIGLSSERFFVKSPFLDLDRVEPVWSSYDLITNMRRSADQSAATR